jgi:hypothetical protein
VDSLAPARSALQTFGCTEFLSLLPKQLKSPPGEGTAFARPGISGNRPANPVVQNSKDAARVSPSPWGQVKVYMTIAIAASAGGNSGWDNLSTENH